MLTTFEADNHVIQALKAEQAGYVLKDSQQADRFPASWRRSCR